MLNTVRKSARGGYTLVELLVTTLIITMLAAVVLVGISGAREIARENRTRAQIAQLKELLAPMYNAYRTRAVPLRAPFNAQPRQIPALRLRLVRELMRMEMPDRVTDVTDTATTFNINTTSGTRSIPPLSSALHRSFLRRAIAATGATGKADLEIKWTVEHQGSECLYMIIGSIQDGDLNGIDFLLDDEIGDTDGDGMPEILDAWGNPIEFLRWAPGHQSLVQSSTTEPDPFDPLQIDPRARTGGTYAMAPLVVSGGKSEQIDLIFDTATPHRYKPASSSPDNEPNDPFATNFGAPDPAGSNQGDNITNHNVSAGT